MFDVLSEVALIALAATAGTFLWNHGSPIFNAGKGWGRAFLMDMQKYWKAYIAFAVILAALVVVVYYRTHDNSEVIIELRELQEDINQQESNDEEIINILNQINENLNRLNGRLVLNGE